MKEDGREFHHWVIECRRGELGVWVTYPEQFVSAKYARSYAVELDPAYEFRIVKVTLIKEIENG